MTAPDEPAAVQHLLAHEPGALFVAVIDGVIVGSAIAAWDGWRGHLYRVAVSAQWQRQGIGRELVEAGQRRLLKLGATRVNIAVGMRGASASFWLALGYHPDPEISRFAKEL